MNYLYSPSAGGFFPLADKEIFIMANLWPSDGIEITESEHDVLFPVPNDKIIGLNNGKPAWMDLPPPTNAQRIEQTELYRQALLKQADEITADWRTELLLDEISDVNREKLSVWMAYKREVKAVDISTAPDISWPLQPEV